LKKILIVEDERILAVSLKMDLNEIGYENITIVTNCDDALDIVRQGNLDLALLDINIQGDKTGIDTAYLISEKSEIPVIFLTGETDFETRFKAESAPNCKGYLTKPVKLDILQPLIFQIFSLSPV
jgi:DNA-binding response OmpR family regulator